MAIASAGNLAISQSVLSTLTEGLEDPHTGDLETLLNAPTMFQAAQRIGRAIRAVHATEGIALQSEDINFDVSFLFGGQIKGSRMRLFMVYTAGNFIECTTDTPYLQIGEHKYGKPILDRAVKYDTDLYDALKIGLISMDSTMRSNLAVGLPIDLAVIPSEHPDDLRDEVGGQEPLREVRVVELLRVEAIAGLGQPDEDHVPQLALGIVGNADCHDRGIVGARDVLVLRGVKQAVRYLRHPRSPMWLREGG